MQYTRCLRHTFSHAKATQYDPYNALTQVFSTEAADSGNLQGLTYVVKENICTTRGATTCCSAILGAGTEQAYKSPFDATCITLLTSAGSGMIGKTNMDEFGMGSFNSHSPYGPTYNPYNHNCTAGGSSGGSAAALYIEDISGRTPDFALGTDTGGSIRIPASYCGLFGFKPSYGRISRWGVVPYANSLDTVSILAKGDHGLNTIRRVFGELDKKDVLDPTSLSNKTREKISQAHKRPTTRPLRIGVPAEYNIYETSAAVLDTWQTLLDRLRDKSWEVVPVSLPLTEAALAAYYVLAPSEASSNLQKYSGVFYGPRSEVDRLDGQLYASTRNKFGDEVKRRILMGCLSLSSDKFDNYYLQAQRIRRQIIHEFNGVFTQTHPILSSASQPNEHGVDFLVTPTAPTVAPQWSEISRMKSAESYAADVFTVPASMAGLPSISIPSGTDGPGMPIGMQIIGQYGDDYGLLDMVKDLKN